MFRIALHTLGCRLNEAETETWARDFRARGARLVGADEPADLVVVNTCAVTAEAVRKSRRLLRRVQRANPGARLVVSGCAVSLPAEALPVAGIDLLVPNRDKDRLAALATDTLALPLMPVSATDAHAAALFARGRQRAFVKIQDGCRYQCSFCVTTLARGAERSRPVSEIVREVNALAAAGIQEVVLTGVHAAGYGSDLGLTLVDLLDAILNDTDLPRLRLGSLEPWDLPAAFFALFADPRLLPHLHLPVQSGSDAILKRMARRCKRADFLALAEQARAAVPDLNLTTDVIVGFPGETDADWRATLNLVARIGFGHLHIFAFSPRAGTRAAGLADPVPEAIKRARGRELHALGRELKASMLARQVGQTVPVLTEGAAIGPDVGPAGYTPNYLPVRLPADGLAPSANCIVPVHLTGVSADGGALMGVVAAR